MEYATGETRGYLYCGEVTLIRSVWMRLQEVEPRLLIRPPSTRCNCWKGSAQETREWKTLWTAQVEAVARELSTQQATMTQVEVRSRGSLVDVQNELSGKQDREEVALDGDMLGTNSILQSSKSAACDPGYGMEHP